MANQKTATDKDGTKEEGIKRVEERWMALLQALDGIPVEGATEPGASGTWSVKDLVGHIAFWDRQAEIVVKRRAAGEPSPENDWQAMNEASAAANADRSFADLERELHETHQGLLTTLRSAESLDLKALGEDTFDHYDEHAAEIWAWRERSKR